VDNREWLRPWTLALLPRALPSSILSPGYPLPFPMEVIAPSPRGSGVLSTTRVVGCRLISSLFPCLETSLTSSQPSHSPRTPQVATLWPSSMTPASSCPLLAQQLFWATSIPVRQCLLRAVAARSIIFSHLVMGHHPKSSKALGHTTALPKPQALQPRLRI
jgi:hypothetical protein